MTTPLLCDPLTHQGKCAEADSLYLRAIEIWEMTFGPEHLNVASALNKRAELLETQVRSGPEKFWRC